MDNYDKKEEPRYHAVDCYVVYDRREKKEIEWVEIQLGQSITYDPPQRFKDKK